MKRFAGIIFATVLILTLIPATTWAESTDESPVAKVGETTYNTLIDAINAAYELGEGQTITLLRNYEVETSENTTYLLPDNSTLDLDGKTLTVPYLAAVFEGKNITIQNGRFESEENYAIWIGNGENETSATLKNITSNAGVNVFVADAVLEDCSIDAGDKTYYAVWADEASTVTVNSGSYYSGENGVVGTSSNGTGKIEIYGGNFSFERFVPSEENDNVVIHSGTFSGEIDSKYIDAESNLVKDGDEWKVVSEDDNKPEEDTTPETKGGESDSTVTEPAETTGTTAVPVTGDESNAAALIILLFVSGGTVAGITIRNRRRHNI